MSRLRLWISALRTPVLLWAGALAFVRIKSLLPNLVLIMNHVRPNSMLSILRLRPDYFLYLPNAVVVLAYLLGTFVLLEVKHRWYPQNRDQRSDRVTAVIGLGVALSSVPLMGNMKPGLLQLVMAGIPVALLWIMMLCNAGLNRVHRSVTSRQWFARLAAWTFPISDLLFYLPHRQRLRAIGWGRFIPAVSYVALVTLAFAVQGRNLWGALRAEPLKAPIITAQWALHDEHGLWFSNDDWWDPLCGIWYYDDRSREARPVIRAADVRMFHLDDGSLYFHDRYDHHLVKMDVRTRQIVWKVPVRPSGTFDLWLLGDRVVAQGEGGYIVVLSKDGRIQAQRTFSMGTWCFQPIYGDRLAFLSGDAQLHVWDLALTHEELIPFPMPQGVIKFPYDMQGGYGGFGLWTDYDAGSAMLYVSTLWGDIFRYDAKQGQWLPSLKASPGIRAIKADRRNGLLFALNHFQGYLDVIDLDSGDHVGSILVNALGRHINLDPVRMKGALSTHGYGVYRFEYGDLMRHRRTLAHVRA